MKWISGTLFLILCAITVGAISHAPAQTADLKSDQCLGGEPDAPIRIEVFSDFECPACRQLYIESMRQVLKDYCIPDKVCLVYHEFPLQGHKYSRLAARYAKAAQKMGRKPYQAVVDALFENQEKWALDGSVDDFAFKALGADPYFSLKKLLLDPSIDSSIDAEIAMGNKKEVTSTPTLFLTALNREQKAVGYVPYLILKDYFDKIVK
jgi:protein-disulfide isomerase